jgi:hypothetical protein
LYDNNGGYIEASALINWGDRTIAPLELEGLTDRHPAMKAARKVAIDLHRFRGIVESLRAPDRVSAKQQEIQRKGRSKGDLA